MNQIRARRIAGMILACAITATAVAAKPTASLAPWTYRADWTGGFSGWMSFPLAQDMGYDPTLYTVKQGRATVLRHNFVSLGQPDPWFGFIRPLRFIANAQSEITLTYRLKLACPLTQAEVMLAGPDGRRYTAALASGPGEHTVRISGTSLHLKGATAVQALILRGRLLHPPLNAESQWILEKVSVHGEQAPRVSLSAPRLIPSIDGSWIAQKPVFAGEDLRVTRLSSSTPATISLYDGQGAFVGEHRLATGEATALLRLGGHPAPGLWKAEVLQGKARTNFRFLLLGNIPPHPRLLLPASRLDELSHAPGYAWLRKQIHARAQSLANTITYNKYAGTNIELMPLGPGIEPAMPGQMKPYRQVAENYADAVVYNALDFRLSGDRGALDSARKALATMAAWETWEPRRFQTHGFATYYEVGVIAQRVAFGYDLIADQLSAREKENTAAAFLKQVIRPTVEECFTSNRDPLAASNHTANSVGGALEAAVAIAGDTPQWRERAAPAIAKLQFAYEELLQGLFPGDGSEAEPFGYENFAMVGLSWGMSSLHALGIRPLGSDRMIQGFWWPYYASVKPGMQLDTGDFNGHLTGFPGYAWAAEFSGISELRALYESGAHLSSPQATDSRDSAQPAEYSLDPIDLACCSEPTPSFRPPPPSRVFPLRGSAALRSGWGPDATVISLRVGPWFNHEHHDEGSFQVAAFGNELIGEAGYSNYYVDPRYKDYFTQASGHNTLLVDGNPFSQTALAPRIWPAFQQPRLTAQMLSPGFDYLAADLTSAYDGKLQRYERQFLFLKPDTLIVRDVVRSPRKHVFTWLLHAPPNSSLAHHEAAASIQVRSAHASLVAAGGNAAWSVVNTPIPVTLFSDLDRSRIEPRREFVLTSPSTTATQFLVGMRFSAGVVSRQPELQAWSEPAGQGLRTSEVSGGGSVVFRTGPGNLRIGGLDTDGSILARKAGDWMAIGARSVKDEGRTLFCSETPADVAWTTVRGGIELTLRTRGGDTVAVLRIHAPTLVTVDGHVTAIDQDGKMLMVRLLSAGDHKVSIR